MQMAGLSMQKIPMNVKLALLLELMSDFHRV